MSGKQEKRYGKRTLMRIYGRHTRNHYDNTGICVMSDMSTSKAGTITSGEDRFMEWKTKDGSYENTQYDQFDTFFEGMFPKMRLLDIIKNFICLSNEGLYQRQHYERYKKSNFDTI